jgi:hypothetical protein
MTVLVLAAALAAAQQPAPMRVQPDGKAEERPLYRKLRPGEQRAEGLLRRINCPGRGPVTFVVKQKDTVLQFTAPQLTSVDFIVYRKDFRGPVTCQGFGAGEPVYVTWKPDGKAQRAIAVEFLPK